jgi:hypothetical protein
LQESVDLASEKPTTVQVKSIEGAVDPELLLVPIFTEQELRYYLKSSFCLTKETGEHNLGVIGTKCIGIPVRESLMVQTSHCILCQSLARGANRAF